MGNCVSTGRGDARVSPEPEQVKLKLNIGQGTVSLKRSIAPRAKILTCRQEIGNMPSNPSERISFSESYARGGSCEKRRRETSRDQYSVSN